MTKSSLYVPNKFLYVRNIFSVFETISVSKEFGSVSPGRVA
jgi:hypothetical protein